MKSKYTANFAVLDLEVVIHSLKAKQNAAHLQCQSALQLRWPQC